MERASGGPSSGLECTPCPRPQRRSKLRAARTSRRSTVLPLDPTTDLFDGSTFSPFTMAGDVVVGGAGDLVVYQVVGPTVLRAVRQTNDVRLEF